MGFVVNCFHLETTGRQTTCLIERGAEVESGGGGGSGDDDANLAESCTDAAFDADAHCSAVVAV